ncbi:helix-turn-helix domain-containing protein [Bacillus pacificus]
MLNTQRIKSLRQKNGYSLEYVSKALGLKFKRSYHNVEKGESGLSVEKLKKLSELYGVSISDLISERDFTTKVAL